MSASPVDAKSLHTTDSSDLHEMSAELCTVSPILFSTNPCAYRDDFDVYIHIDADSTEPDIYEDHDETEDDNDSISFPITSRSPTEPQAEAQKRIDDAARVIKWSMKKSLTKHVVAYSMAGKASDRRKEISRSIWAPGQDHKSVEKSLSKFKEWTAKENFAYKQLKETGRLIERVGAINRATRKQMQESFPPMPNYKKGTEINKGIIREASERKAATEKAAGNRARGKSFSRKNGG